MDPLLDVVRHEVKFASEGIRFGEVEQWVRLHPAGFYNPFPPRRVNNVYFDNHVLFAYQENLVGASMRSKVRLRWYGETFQPEGGTLEIKRRRNLVGWKLSWPTEGFDLGTTTWHSLRRALRRQLSAEARIWLDANPQPVLINRYYRRYWVSADGRVRVTIDGDQSVYDQRTSDRPNTTRRTNLPDTLVVEFKFAPTHRPEGSNAIQGIPIRVSRNSKYVIGVQSLTGF
jgi:hypothetical protein